MTVRLSLPLTELALPPLAAALMEPNSAIGAELGHVAATRDAMRARVTRARSSAAPELLDAWRAAASRRGAPSASLAEIDKLRHPGSVAVVAGQQPGLLLGPHLVISKALQAIAVARWIEAELSVPAAAVFWAATEDHDHAEADHTVWLDADGAWERLRCRLPEDRRMLSEVPWTASDVERLREWLGRLGGRLDDGVLASLQTAARETVGAGFVRGMEQLLGPLGIAVVEPSHLRAAAWPVLQRELERPGELHAALVARLERVEAAGLVPPLAPVREQHFFLLESGRREAVVHRDGAFRLADGRGHTADEWLARGPASFSWNVATRVLAQQVALPVVAQICGPSELGYGAVLSSLHEAFGREAPLLVPRSGVTWLSVPVERAIRNAGIDVAELVTRGETATAEVETPLADAAERRFREVLPELLVESSNEVRNRHGALRAAMERYVGAVRRVELERRAVEVRRNQVALGGVRPAGRLQERVASALPLLAQSPGDTLERWAALLREWWHPAHHVESL